MGMENELLTVEEAALWLRVQPDTIRTWIRARKLPAVKLGRSWRLRSESLRRMVEQGERPVLPGPEREEALA